MKKNHKNKIVCKFCGWKIEDGVCLGCDHVQADILESQRLEVENKK